MDLNIGAALWMAAKAEGHVTVVPAATASRQQTHRHQAAKQAGPEAAAAFLIAAPHVGSISNDGTCSSTPPSNLQSSLPQMTRHTAADVAQRRGNLGDRSGLLQHARASQEIDAQAASTSTASSPTAALHDAAASTAALSGGEEQVVEEQNDCTGSLGAVPSRIEPADDERNGCMRHGWYKSAARVVLLGHGADEQHAGYGRHRTSFRNQVSPISLKPLDHLCMACAGKVAPSGSAFFWYALR